MSPPSIPQSLIRALAPALRPALCCAGVLMLVACAKPLRVADAPVAERPPVQVTRYEGNDDLLTAGLGRAGLLGPAPAVVDPEAPTAAELRRRAIYTNWRGIIDLVGSVGELPAVPGREYMSWRTVANARFPHRVLLQVPDGFDVSKPCLVVTASSGSRGIYGAIGSAGHYALSRGCAVAYTDKGAGTDWFDPVSGEGFALDGRLVPAEQSALLHGKPDAAPYVAIKHVHSSDNPEASWGDSVLQAAQFGLEMLGQAFPAHAPFTDGRTRVLAFGLSNGGGAVLRAAEKDTQGLLDAVVAAAPNIHVPGQLSLYDIALEAAIFQPCVVLDGPPPAFVPEPLWRAPAEQRCRSLKALGWIRGNTLPEQARSARERMTMRGITDAAQRWAGLNQVFDLWRAVVTGYAQAYARAGVDQPVCGYRFAMLDAQGAPRAATRAERSLWWSDASGLAPTAGVQIVDTLASGDDPALNGLMCLHTLRRSQDDPASAVMRQSLDATRATTRPAVPVLIVHGTDDSLVPMALTGQAYAAAARRQGVPAIGFWEIKRAQHFDAFVNLPAMAGQVQPLLPQAYEAMDLMRAHLDGGPFPGDRVVD